MTPETLLAALRNRGLTVRLDDDLVLRVGPRERLNDEDREAVRANKADLRELLFAEMQLPDWDADLYDPPRPEPEPEHEREPARAPARKRRKKRKGWKK